MSDNTQAEGYCDLYGHPAFWIKGGLCEYCRREKDEAEFTGEPKNVYWMIYTPQRAAEMVGAKNA